MSTLANPAAARTSTPDRKSLQRIAAEALHSKSVTIDRIHGTLYRNYKLQPTSHSAAAATTTEETFYILKCRPSSPAIRLLRHEEDRLRTEAYTLQTLLLHSSSSSSSSTKPSEMPSTRMIPRLIASSPHHHHHHRTNTTTTPLDPSPYIITGPYYGHLLSEISPQLPQTPSERIQQRVGFLYRTLTTSFSPCCSSSSTQQQPQTKPFGPLHPSSSSSSLKSFTTWSQFYTTLLETLLLDAEDALINLPYAFIRETVRRNQNSLDRITKPKLVFLEGLMDERNILVRRRRLESSADERRSEDEWEISGILDWSGVIWGDEWMSDGFYDHFSKRRSLGGFLEGFLGGKGRQNQRRSGEEVVRQYLYVFFLFSLLLSLSPYRSIDVIYILFGSTNQNKPSSSSSSSSLTSSSHSHHNRYILYHSLLAIIRQCYRPSSSSSSSSPSSLSNNTNEEYQQTELAARRNLTNALTQLSKICNFEVR